MGQAWTRRDRPETFQLKKTVAMVVVVGLFPAIRAVRLDVSSALRQL
jgi:ABC-type lipoprotein release transport system permease subunit